MWVYQGVYRCKLCGKIFYGDAIDSRSEMDPDRTHVNTFAWHFYDCEDRCYGAGEAIGIRVVKDEQEYWDD